MSAQPAGPRDDGQPDNGQPAAGGQEAALSGLEQALRRALASMPRAQVLSCLATALPIEIDTGSGSRLHGAPRSRPPQDKVQKVSVSMPTKLADLVRTRTGAGGFSRYVTDAVQEQVRLDLLADLSAELEAEYGPVDEEQVEQAMREWPDFAE